MELDSVKTEDVSLAVMADLLGERDDVRDGAAAVSSPSPSGSVVPACPGRELLAVEVPRMGEAVTHL